MISAVRLELFMEANRLLDGLRDRHCYRLDSDDRIAVVEETEDRLRAILALLAGMDES